MGRPRNRPAEFISDEQWEAHHEALERELAGRSARLAELKAADDVEPAILEQAEAEVEAVHAQLDHYGWGQKKAAKRPAGAAKSKRA